MAKYQAACSDCGQTSTVSFKPVPGTYFCSECFAKNYDVKSIPYVVDFVLFLGRKLALPSEDRIDVVRLRPFLYQLSLREKEAKTVTPICTIELRPTGEIAAKGARFIAVFSAKGAKVRETRAHIGEFILKNGIETVAPVKALRKF